MIIYFADRNLNILGNANTNLPNGYTIIDDKKIEDIETGVATFEATISFDKLTRTGIESWADVGNYILRKHDNENEFYTIIDAELDTKNQEVYIYAEDAGLDLLNEVVGTYAADKAYPISHYINKFAGSSGFVIGINEAASLTRKLSWDGEATVTERLASVATQFDNCEISFSFDIDGLAVTKMYINIYKKRGHDIGCQLRLNYDVDKIITKKSIANVATALQVTGGTPENKDTPITLSGYKYDDGDCYVSGTRLYSRKALQKWGRLPIGKSDHIVKQYSYDTTSQSNLCSRAVGELKKIRDMEVNYEADILKFPENTKIGDRINIIDDAGGLYLSTRILKFETSITGGTKKATLGEHLLKGSGISQKVIELAEEFAKQTISVQHAQNVANAAKDAADDAKTQADSALTESQNAQQVANDAKEVADTASQSAAEATQKAQEMAQAVDKVEESVASIEKTVEDAKTAADNAYIAADTANKKADEAKQEAANAVENAADAKEAATGAATKADSAIAKADEAVTTANTAKDYADAASTTAAAAKLDAEQAKKDIVEFGKNLETVKETMEADYARKTDLTATEAHLQTQISQNAENITQTANKVTVIDETANNAKELANKASADAELAKNQANAATSEAEAAQQAADDAKLAADAAQTNADTAKKAADDAKLVADKAETDLANAKADLETVQGRVDATEEEIADAQEKVTAAQTAADKAKADATAAVEKATNAQSVADSAVESATNAQNAADDAANKAAIAQKTAEEAKGNAEKAQQTADAAAQTAANAQSVADKAVENASNAQSVADKAVADALAAQTAANDADAKAQQAKNDLAEAEQNLANVSSKVDATKEEVEAAQSAVVEAQAAAEKAKADAIAAQNTADTARADAVKAQEDATNAKLAADNAQKQADEAKAAADKAQADADALAVRVTSAETKITQNAEKIELAATKTEVAETLGGYYTKEETNAQIKVESDKISQTVTSQVETAVDKMQIGARNLLRNTENFNAWTISGIAEFIFIKTDVDVANFPIQTEYAMRYIQSTADIKKDDVLNKDIVLSLELCSDTDWTPTEANDNAVIAEFSFCTDADLTRKVYKLINITEPIKTDWQKYEIKLKLTPDILQSQDGGTVDECTRFYFRLYDASINHLQARKIKLEIGNKSTDWSPAPEDFATAENVDNLENLTQQQEEKIIYNESQIAQFADLISTLVADAGGESLFEQTADGWVFNIKQFLTPIEKELESLDEINSSIGGLEQSTAGVADEVNKIKESVNELTETNAYISMGVDDAGDPCLLLGNSASDFKVRITNKAIDFLNGAIKLAYINKEAVSIGIAFIENDLIIGGGWKWQKRASGNLGLRWEV